MTPRLGGVVVLAAVLLGATITPAEAAITATSQRAVALQVQYPNGSVRVWCVPYRTGMTGADVLARADPTYGTGPYAGFVLQIGGRGSVPPTTSRYWAYWRSATGKATDYTYSSAGVTSTHPPLRSVETWVWTTSASTPVPRTSFARLCPGA
jgi:hypothetical protein